MLGLPLQPEKLEELSRFLGIYRDGPALPTGGEAAAP